MRTWPRSGGVLRRRASAREATPARLTAAGLREALAAAADRLGGRVADHLEALEAVGSRYQVEVASGPVAEELERTAVAVGADLIVYGQHCLYHRDTRMSGRCRSKRCWRRAGR